MHASQSKTIQKKCKPLTEQAKYTNVTMLSVCIVPPPDSTINPRGKAGYLGVGSVSLVPPLGLIT